MANKYGVKCNIPKCGSQSVWKQGFVPTAEGRKDKFKCTVCGHVFHRGQPGTTVASAPSRKKKSK